MGLALELAGHERHERVHRLLGLVKDGVNLAEDRRGDAAPEAEVVQRLRPLAREEALARNDTRRRLAQELDRLSSMLGL